MSWDGYVDSVIQHGKGNVSKAAIIGLDGSVWTPSTRAQVMNVLAAEALTVGKTMAGSSPKDVFAANGITLEGVKYMFLRDLDNDGKIMTGKKKDLGNIVLQKTKSAVVIAFVPDGSTAAMGNTAVDNIAKYLEGLGY